MDSTSDASEFVTINHPGMAFRPVPSFAFDVPPDWLFDEYPGALCVMGPPQTEDGVWANIILRHQRVSHVTTIEDIALQTWEALQITHPDAVPVDERILRFGYVHYMREVDIPGSVDEEATNRIDSFVFGPDAEFTTVDLFHFTWLHPAAAANELKPIYVKILSSFNFTDEFELPDVFEATNE